MSAAIATYLPESMLIRIGPDLRILDENGKLIPLPSARVFAYFFHEYVHFLHNISTASGIAAFINTLELWRCFRLTIDESGNSLGSSPLDPAQKVHLKELTALLDSVRRENVPSLQQLTSVEIVEVQGIDLLPEVTTTQQGILLSVIECQVEAIDNGNQVERLTAKIGILELLECAAWLLEKKMVAALNPEEDVAPPPFFPYRIAQAVVEYSLPGVDDEGVLSCILAALQNSDAPSGFAQLLSAAQQSNLVPNDASSFFRERGNYAIAQNREILDAQLSALEEEFANEGVMAKAVCHTISVARQSFAKRERDPFFELEMISALQNGTLRSDQMFTEILPCAVLQKNRGDEDKVQRDFFLSFHPGNDVTHGDIESLLRTMHCIFHYIRAHRSPTGFKSTQRAQKCECPFYSSCDLKLRVTEPWVCRQSPWKAENWMQIGQENGLCRYGAAVSITRPPHET